MYKPDEFLKAERPVTLKYAERIQEQYSWQDDVLKVTTGIVHEMDKWREMEICNHFNCDLSEFREWLAKKQEHKRQTNADRIRAMSDEELAWFYAKKIALCYGCESSTMEDCAKCWLDWLRKDATE